MHYTEWKGGDGFTGVLVECYLCVQWRDVLLSPNSQREMPAFCGGRMQTLISVVFYTYTQLLEMLAAHPGILFVHGHVTECMDFICSWN